MKVSKEELLKIANLSSLKIDENEIEEYLVNLEDILEFANVVNEAPVEGLNITVGTNENFNRFRKDEIIEFDKPIKLLDNVSEKSQNMIKIPKVL